MANGKRKKSDLLNLENHPYLSKKLVDIIYNPELPFGYRFLSESRKLYVLQMLYLSLNPSFQKEFGKRLAKWIDQAEIDAEEFIREDFIKKEAVSGYTVTYTHGKTFFIPIELCMILLRSEIIYIHLLRDAEMDDMIDANGKWNASLFAEVLKLSPYRFGPVFESRRIDQFQEFVKARKENYVPCRIFAAIDISKPKETIIEAFSKYIDHMQELHFKQNPTLQHPLYGHEEHKSDGRRKTYPFDKLERYFKAYVYYARGMKQQDIARELLSKNEPLSAEACINQDIRKAKALIKNAWNGTFPVTMFNSQFVNYPVQ